MFELIYEKLDELKKEIRKIELRADEDALFFKMAKIVERNHENGKTSRDLRKIIKESQETLFISSDDRSFVKAEYVRLKSLHDPNRASN